MEGRYWSSSDESDEEDKEAHAASTKLDDWAVKVFANKRRKKKSVTVTLPANCKEGDWFKTLDKNGKKFAFQVPAGVEGGQTIEVEAPSRRSRKFVKVCIPPDAYPGATIKAMTKHGVSFKIVIPPGKGPGDIIRCAIPKEDATPPKKSSRSDPKAPWALWGNGGGGGGAPPPPPPLPHRAHGAFGSLRLLFLGGVASSFGIAHRMMSPGPLPGGITILKETPCLVIALIVAPGYASGGMHTLTNFLERLLGASTSIVCPPSTPAGTWKANFLPFLSSVLNQSPSLQLAGRVTVTLFFFLLLFAKTLTAQSSNLVEAACASLSSSSDSSELDQ
uniref:Uncharacterized protein n=1 Tax=Hemiselmis andersenii TaxID=464988 RepID=A0A7S0U6R8_HEMAN